MESVYSSISKYVGAAVAAQRGLITGYYEKEVPAAVPP